LECEWRVCVSFTDALVSYLSNLAVILQQRVTGIFGPKS